jgi:membrane-bound lytic murein transglycosylase B
VRTHVVLAAALALGLAAVGCGGDGADDSGATGGTPDATTTSAAPALTSTTAAPTTSTTAPTPAVPSALAPIVDGAPPRAADDPAGLAEQLGQAEAVIRDPAAPPELVDAAGRLSQLVYRRLAGHPEWDASVLAAVDPSVRPAVTAVVAARREFRGMHPTLSDTLPAWRIVEPLPADQLLALYQEAEATYGVPWPVLAAVHLTETAMGRIQGLSVAGAQGPMQFMPGTWEAYGLGGDVNDPRDAILGAANYLRANGGADGSVERVENALYRYNNSERYVRGVRAIADVIAAEPITYRGFHAWDVVYLSTAGEVLLDTGYEAATPTPAVEYLAAHPDAWIH